MASSWTRSAPPQPLPLPQAQPQAHPFAAFLPQFIDPARNPWVQFAVMAGTFVVVESITELVIAGTAARVRPWLQRVGRRFNQVCGGLFILIGAALPLR